ncbi:MAG: zinc ABC transporter substrate-binding protein [Proteobacteria bacterium]|nr:zinc ABC transporter substrate-binding protein [Pseudomonadota bacterium]
MHKFFIISFILFLSATASADVSVAATIRPLQFIAEAIVGNHGSVTSVIDENDSPHQYTISPSDRINLAKANVLVWISPEFEVFLQNVFASSNQRGDVIQASALDGMRLHTFGNGIFDPHLWLDSGNAVLIAEAIAARVSSIDTDNARAYQLNLDNFKQRVELANQTIIALLSRPATGEYLVYHDAYQYFEKQFRLKHGLVLLDNPEVQPSMRDILQVRQRIRELSPKCLLLESDSNLSLVDTLLDDLELLMEPVDLLGYTVNASGERGDRYTQLLNNVAESFARCLYVDKSDRAISLDRTQ